MELEEILDLADRLNKVSSKLDFIDSILCSNIEHDENSQDGMAHIVGEINDEVKSIRNKIH